MPLVKITKDTLQLIRKNAVWEFRDTSRPLSDGMVLIELDNAVIGRLEELMFPTESHDECLQRLLRVKQ